MEMKGLEIPGSTVKETVVLNIYEVDYHMSSQCLNKASPKRKRTALLREAPPSDFIRVPSQISSPRAQLPPNDGCEGNFSEKYSKTKLLLFLST
ncbi:hypothetical protein CEXT_78241 [Caerostris extrusa]|uniref:Uncharacterized protein n=1 Tax=Caerostris extrusa TaxID=172846 RepID=A0AAV4X0E5_CAEEX|nr:hypothetical protein CEXT_78241 [Caerostris extrusa]